MVEAVANGALDRLDDGIENTDPGHLGALAREISTEPPAPKRRRGKGKSPTARSLEHLRKSYPLVDIVERRLPHAFITHDMFGIIDLVAVSETEILAVQTTSASNMADRVAKIAESAALPILLKVGIRVIVHGWRKNAAGRWVLREVEL